MKIWRKNPTPQVRYEWTRPQGYHVDSKAAFGSVVVGSRDSSAPEPEDEGEDEREVETGTKAEFRSIFCIANTRHPHAAPANRMKRKRTRSEHESQDHEDTLQSSGPDIDADHNVARKPIPTRKKQPSALGSRADHGSPRSSRGSLMKSKQLKSPHRRKTPGVDPDDSSDR
jgi:hypothetical protein